MPLRKCPSCKEVVGADSAVCPRCGVGFRGASMRRAVRWAVIVAIAVWIVCRYVLKLGVAHVG